jgi:hypothetical protein
VYLHLVAWKAVEEHTEKSYSACLLKKNTVVTPSGNNTFVVVNCWRFIFVPEFREKPNRSVDDFIFLPNSRKYLPDAPSSTQLLRNLSGCLINQHPALDFPRSMPPSFIQMLGVGTDSGKAQQLPNDLRDGIHQYFYNFSIFFLSFF